MKHKLYIALGLSLFGTAAMAQSLPPASIQSLGCDQATNRCSLTLNLEQVGPAECTANQITWESDSEQGKLAVALLSSAMMTNHQVEIELSNACYNALPELASFNVLARKSVK
ncbi:hypothetical protein TUMSATVNIG1_33530 [Vibrio nigripulchritudo]|uniref:hypothetical protein n=1 Tax=Vibrio nigripulchritudo TaxID=28173 RepID=UPI001909E30F|nr:hypothetical protein [Vibrio nigripulchritudo]BCL71387.1 hypothetical protein VNTUMSATTG_33240 [Vibrio nigripulchritudo]BDU32744.1 hypothetical protein TUMSATVNIG1_33530 [Vibrio nigripulchritudo]